MCTEYRLGLFPSKFIMNDIISAYNEKDQSHLGTDAPRARNNAVSCYTDRLDHIAKNNL